MAFYRDSFVADLPHGWIIGPDQPSAARVRLLCIGHAGSGPSFFRPWCSRLQPDVEVVRASLPGRERRHREKPLVSVDEIVEALCEAMEDYYDKPVALFGHSMGAIVAYELARRLRQQPVYLFVSGRRAPHLPPTHEPFYTMENARLLEVLASLDGTPSQMLDEKTLSTFLPSLRADFRANETYRQTSQPRLTCPLGAYAGIEDPEVNPAEIAEWRHVTTGRYECLLFPGGHFERCDCRHASEARYDFPSVWTRRFRLSKLSIDLFAVVV
jgi:medium-chain acyl-[acyl-carrier-protein] hydrolase